MSHLTSLFSNNVLVSEVPCRHLVEICPAAILIHHNNSGANVNDEYLWLVGASQHEQKPNSCSTIFCREMLKPLGSP